MHLHRLGGHPQRHLVAEDLGRCRHERIGERIRRQAGAIQQAARRLDVLEHVGQLPADALEIGDRLAEDGALADIVHRLVERALGETERDRRIQAALGVEGRQQLAKAILADDQVLQRQFAVVELDLVQIFAAHGVVGAGHLEALRAGLEQHAADALAARLAIDPGEHDEHAGLPRSADQCLRAFQHDAVADHARVGAVVGDVGAGVRFGHADRQDAVAADHLRQDAVADRSRRIAGDDPGLHAGLAQHRHRRHVVDLGDFLQDQRGIEDRQAEAAVFLRHRHAQHAELGELASCSPRGTCRPSSASRAGLEFGLRQRPHRGDHLPLLRADLEVHGGVPPAIKDASVDRAAAGANGAKTIPRRDRHVIDEWMEAALRIPTIMTVQEFLAWDAPSGPPWQLVDGEPQAMAPASRTARGPFRPSSDGLSQTTSATAAVRARCIH